MKVTVAMDSFKGSLTSLEAGNAVKYGILDVCPDAEVTVIPLADGGEGTIDALMPYIHGISKTITVRGPLGDAVEADYVFEPTEKCAYIEMAKSSGLTLVNPDERDPYRASTYGTGELIKDAVLNGAEKQEAPQMTAERGCSRHWEQNLRTEMATISVPERSGLRIWHPPT